MLNRDIATAAVSGIRAWLNYKLRFFLILSFHYLALRDVFMLLAGAL